MWKGCCNCDFDTENGIMKRERVDIHFPDPACAECRRNMNLSASRDQPPSLVISVYFPGEF